MTYDQYSAAWLAAHCDIESAFERALKKQLTRLLEESADYRATCERLLREITALKVWRYDELLQAKSDARAYKQAYFQLIEQVAAGQSLRAPPPPPPIQMEMPPEFFEWRAMHPSLTDLQAFLVWKKQKETKA